MRLDTQISLLREERHSFYVVTTIAEHVYGRRKPPHRMASHLTWRSWRAWVVSFNLVRLHSDWTAGLMSA